MDLRKIKFRFCNLLNYKFLFILLLAQILFFAEILSASPDYLTLQSRIVQPDGHNLEAASVNYRFSITDPVGTCVVYQEDFSNVNMVDSKGLVAIKIGSGTRGYPVAATTMKDIFTNFNSPIFNCQAGGTYTAASSDQRKLVMQFNDGSGWQTVPSLEINSTPFSLESLSAQKLGLFPAGDYVRSAQFATCVGGEAVHFNGTNFTCVTLGGAASSVAAAAGLAGTPSISFSGDTNTGLYSGAADTISISNNGSNTFNITSTALSSTTTGGATITQINGTAAAPTFSFAGDADTGWYRAAADTLAASTAGVERIRIDSSGNVGVGTTSPIGTLTVKTGTDNTALNVVGSTGSEVFRVKTNTNYGILDLLDSTGTPKVSFNSYANNGPLILSDGSGSNKIDGANTSFGAALWLYSPHVTGQENGIFFSTGGNVAGAAITYYNANNATWANGGLKFKTTSVGTVATRMTIDPLGNVGIGTVAPDSSLHIQGRAGIYGLNIRPASDTEGLLKLQTSTGGVGLSVSTAFNGTSLRVFDSAGTLRSGLFSDLNQGPNLFANASGSKLDGASDSYGAGIYIQTPSGAGNENGVFFGDGGISSSPGASITFYDTFAGNTGRGGLKFKTSDATTGGTLTRMTIDQLGNVGIGTATPNSLLTVTGTTSAAGISNVTATVAPTFAGYRSNGTLLSPTAPVANDVLAQFVGYASEGDGTFNSGGGLAVVREGGAVAVGTINSGIQFLTANGMLGITEKMRITKSGNVGIGTTSPQTILQVEGIISPATNNTYTLGNASYRFTEVYATNGVINTSDRREKKDIYNTDLGLDFINKLRPVSYRWNTGVDSDVHYGLIAQEAEQALVESGQTAKTSIVTHDESTDRYGVRYSELISPLIMAFQELFSRFVSVESHQSHQDREIASLKTENAAMKIYLCSKDKNAPFCK